jgi:hypothetical protein
LWKNGKGTTPLGVNGIAGESTQGGLARGNLGLWGAIPLGLDEQIDPVQGFNAQSISGKFARARKKIPGRQGPGIVKLNANPFMKA